MNAQLDFGARVLQQLDHPAAYPRVTYIPDLFVWTTRYDITEGLTGVSYDLMIGAEQEPSQSWQGRTDQRKRRCRFTTAKVGDGPSCALDYAGRRRRGGQEEERAQGLVPQYEIPGFRALASNAAERTRSILLDVVIGGLQQPNVMANRPSAKHHPRMLGWACCDVHESPHRRLLQHGILVGPHELDESRDDPTVNDSLYGRVVVKGH